jgi:putative transposase
MVEIPKTYKFRLYRNDKKDRKLPKFRKAKKYRSFTFPQSGYKVDGNRLIIKRQDHHFKLAHPLCDSHDVLCFEDLNLTGMKARWERKVSDLGFANFMSSLEWGAFKRSKGVLKTGRWERTTGTCSRCGHFQPLKVRDRVFHCEQCSDQYQNHRGIGGLSERASAEGSPSHAC